MKHLKKITYLLLIAVFAISCEKETLTLENSASETKKIQDLPEDSPLSLFEIMKTGGLDAYFREQKALQDKSASPTKTAQRSYNENVMFFNTAEEFGNNTLTTEDFENAIEDYSWDDYYENLSDPTYSYYISYGGTNSFPRILNENNLHNKFNPGDFTSGISFEQKINEEMLEIGYDAQYYRYRYDDNDEEVRERLEGWIDNNGLFINRSNYNYPNCPNCNSGHDKTLFSNYSFTDLVIKFTESDVNSVNFTLTYNNYYTYKVYDTDENLIATDYSYSYNNFWGVKSNISIGKIEILGNMYGPNNYNFGEISFDYYYRSQLNLESASFGNLDDFDNDGVRNSRDNHPFSNTTEDFYISGAECFLDIENQFARNGSTMMDELDSLIEDINSQYDGDNWEELNRDFLRKLSGITYMWRRDRLISRGERNDILDCARNAHIPGYYDIN